MVDKYPTRVAQGFGLVFLAVLAVALFLIRKYFRTIYALLEIVVGFMMMWDALGFVVATSGASNQTLLDLDSMTGRLFSSDGLKVVAALYVLIRGFVNLDEQPEDNDQNKKNTDNALPAPRALAYVSSPPSH